MIIVDAVLGNIDHPTWAERLSTAAVDTLEIDQREAQKSRFRKQTARGVEVAVCVDRGSYLRDGDVLLWDEQAHSVIVARIELSDVMVVYLDDLLHFGREAAMRTCVELGHAMGNQHWPAVVNGTRVYVPLIVDRKVMTSVMATHRFEGLRYEFVAGRDVIPHLAPYESRRLFGGTHGSMHSHPNITSSAAGHAHDHGE